MAADGDTPTDIALRDWRQGDCVLEKQWFFRRVDPSVRLAGVDYGSSDDGDSLLESEELGFVLLTQTCDIVRASNDRPYVEVCPLIRVEEDVYFDARRGRRPALAVVPYLEAQRLVADLDRVMTIEKPVVAKWPRTPGCTTDGEARTFAKSLARKRERFAFPTDFGEFAQNLVRRLTGKHEKNSVEGRALRSLDEIRVRAVPSWAAQAGIDLTFWFIRGDREFDFEGKNWADLLERWLQLVPASGRFATVNGQVTTLDDLTAADFVYSDRLDLDRLSP